MDHYGRDLPADLTRVIDGQLASGKWHLERIPGDVTGLGRDLEVIRGPRPARTMLTFAWHGDRDTFCPPLWWDLAIGAGACGYGCRTCFLMLTHRAFNDPLRHRLYDNVEAYYDVVKRWLVATEWPHPNQKGQMVKLTAQTTLGLGIDRSDSLLYEGVTGHARRLIPLFIDPATNPQSRRLVLLTKSANVNRLFLPDGGEFAEAVSRATQAFRAPTDRIPHVSLAFSLNPDPIADLWEGKWPDTGRRITPQIDRRLAAARLARTLGFEVRWRLDPILPVAGWQTLYRDWLAEAVDRFEAQPATITLGTYRRKNDQLDLWRAKWGLPAPEYEPGELVEDGTHWHLPTAARAEIYRTVSEMIQQVWTERGRPAPVVALCKESHALRRAVGLNNASCACLETATGSK